MKLQSYVSKFKYNHYTTRELSCVIGHLFETLDPPCNVRPPVEVDQLCVTLMIAGTTSSGHYGTLYLANDGYAYWMGSLEDLSYAMAPCRLNMCQGWRQYG